MKKPQRSRIFSFVQDVIDGKKKHPFLRNFLIFLSFGLQAGVKLKNALYDRNLISSKKAPLKVDCIGNLTVGGTGKTPFTLFLAKELINEKIAILSRGYRSLSEKKNVLASNGSSAEEIGDEPLLLSRRLKKVPIYIGKDRLSSAVLASEKGAKIVLLDDGFQHRKISLDLITSLLKNTEGVKIFEDRKNNRFASPVDVSGKEDIYVSRIRKVPFQDDTLEFWIVGDQLLKGAALNAVQIAEQL